MTFTGTLDNGRASVRTYQSIPVDGFVGGGDSNGYMGNGYTGTIDRTYTNGHVTNGHAGNGNIAHEPDMNGDRMVRIPSMSETVYNNTYYGNGKGPVPDSPPPPPPVGAPAPPPPPPPPPPM